MTSDMEAEPPASSYDRRLLRRKTQ